MKRLLMIRMIKIGVVCFISQLILLGNVLAQDRRYVHSDTANIRMKPDVKSEKLWEVEKYHPFIVLETKGKWCRIKDYAGDVAWVYKPLLSKGRTVITRVSKSNVRSEGSLNGRILFTVAKGVPFKVLDQTKKWYKVQHADGDAGWISKKLVW